MYWTFELTYKDETMPIEEPVGWDDISFKLKRDKKVHGLVFEFSSDIEVYKSAYRFVLEKYNLEGIRAKVFISIYEATNESTARTLYFYGRLDLAKVNFNETTFKCNIEAVDFIQTFKAQRKVDVQLNVNKEITLRGKTIRQTNRAEINELLNDYLIINDEISTPSWEWKQQELSEPLFINSNDRDQSIYFAPEDNNVDISTRIKGFVQATTNLSAPNNVNIEIAITVVDVIGTSGYLQVYYLYSKTVPRQVENGQSNYYFDTPLYDNTIQIPLPQNTNLFYQIRVQGFPGVFGNFAYGVSIDQDVSFFEMSALTSFPQTRVRGVLLKDAFSQICENYLDQEDIFNSNFLENGCGSKILLTNGRLLRQSENEDLFANFQDLYEDLDKIFSLGYEISEGEIRIEEFEYFYQDNQMLDLDSPRDLKVKVLSELYYSDIKIGYEKWKDTSVGIVNSTDEFNSKRQYKTGITEVEKTLDLSVKKLITAGYLIESVRRLSADKTKTSSFDDDLFLIHLRDDLTASARDENVSLVENVIDPNTVSNIIFSPARILQRWKPRLASMFVRGEDKTIEFASGEGNYEMRSQGNNDCLFSEFLSEKGNFTLNPSEAIFILEEIAFDYPVDFKTFEFIRKNAKAYIKVGKLSGWIYGSQSFKPNEGLMDLKLIRRAKS